MAIALPIPNLQNQHILLQGVSWQTYQALLHDLGNHRISKLAYDHGSLEIMMPSDLHEILNRLLALMITTLTDELGMGIKNYGSTALDREDLAQGVEPDSCFYIQNVSRVLGRRTLNLEIDPAPDLTIEVDITSSSQRRFGIYLQLAIPEVWRYTNQRGLIIYQLQGESYEECAFSPTFPIVSGARSTQFLQFIETEDDNQVIRALRDWIRTET